MLHISDAKFEELVLKSNIPVLVDFWAEWCGPCKRLGPTIETLAADYMDKALIVKMDVDANPIWPMRYGVQSIPTIILFKSGKEIARIVGLAPKNVLENGLNKALLD